MSWWEMAYRTFVEEFSDLGEVAQLVRLVVRLFIAALLGGLMGWERETKAKSAGVRTHMLVAIGSALFVLVPQQLGTPPADLSRVLQGLVAGIGFLGAGAIIKGDKDEEVKGLTTAAGIWLTAAIGMAVGMGREMTAVLSTGLALAVLTAVPHVTRFTDKKPNGR